ncbi:bifunctional phosphopantothenoylcysteine decarboxylase/phosphopantothenate--cysteine ligase CoaBC [Zeaxanthinibacter sp. PT1]|uniref:bifunctional phosphopantothenoylcysteine decarboxylase/phosphopantothenate--cysteine ligase CoaBC n=1 Tax=Zeaxanthinibacter TaxID=561554 RepID=UPI0023490BB9|nr:bifunctional phosphopantothenoylcysteine decarboxylase/phosphopantothenate--cysteine ligase CoaBC [Zeaxanthinibacter sp. PT1]MDC6351741.1 bifunctional phosphopantothenoylcysteine decarboxylase/phosphopantothenate--cysteine ligase CoaBC [Zeaxanthinibacter sp. PT1]
MLGGKNILLGVTGGIAAYKSAFLVRLLIKEGANVKVILTQGALSFVTPLTMATLSKNPALVDFIREEDGEVDWNNHVELGLWADLMLIAPATANTLSKMASGNCDNLLIATYLSAKCPVFFAPAMDLDMYKHPSSVASIKALETFGNTMIPPGTGELASGLHGEGRMAEPEEITDRIKAYFAARMPLDGKMVMITAGPTYEPIDPVRFIGNHSSGRMGFELADVAASLGAKVVLVSGPTHLEPANEAIKLLRVTTAAEMYSAVHDYFEDCDIAICAAAVADYRPHEKAGQKIKKKDDHMQVELVKNPDILKSLGEKKQHQFLVGFALETENEEAHAREKLVRKNLDAIVLNSLRDQGAGFGGDTNKISFLDKNSGIKSFALKSKAEVAKDIFHEIIQRIQN